MNRIALRIGRASKRRESFLRGSSILALTIILLLASAIAISASPLLDAPVWSMTQPGTSEWVQNPVEVVVEVQDGDQITAPNPEYRYTTNGGATWTGWLTDTLVYNQPDTEHATITVTLNSLVDSGTDNRVHFRVTDDALNREYSPEYTILVDESAPAPPQDLAASPASWTNTDAFDLAWTNPGDGSSIVRAYHRLDSAPAAQGDADGYQDGTDLTSLTGLTVGSAGQHTFYVWLQDSAGYSDHTQVASVDVWLDQEAPTSPTNLSVSPDTWSSANAFTISWTNPAESQAPIGKALFKFNSAPISASDTSGEQSGEGISSLVNVQAPVGGAIPCYIWLEDAAGNADYTTAQMVTLYWSGGQAPSAPFAMSISPSSWTQTNSFDIAWTNPTVPSGIVAAWFKWDTAPAHHSDGTRIESADIAQLDDVVAPGQGARPLYVWLEDGAGDRDESNTSQVTAYWDTTVPATTPSYTPALPGTGWFNASHGDVTVDLAATDTHSGVQDTFYRAEGGMFASGTSFSATDTSSWQFYSVDTAGNTEPVQTLSVPIDRQAPNSSIQLTPGVPATGWYAQPVTIDISADDDLSGWNASYYRLDGGQLESGTQLVVSSSGVHTLNYYSRDLAGNQEAENAVNPVCRIDMDAPTITATPNKIETYVQPPVSISLYALDALSGVSQTQYRRQGETTWQNGSQIVIDGSDGDGVYTYEYRAVDVAGNTCAIQTISLNVDGTYPTSASSLTPTPAQWVRTDGGFGLSWTNPSDFSGIVGVYYQIDEDPIAIYNPTYIEGASIASLSDLSVLTDGAHTIYLWLQDGAGNSSEWSSTSLADAFKLDRIAPTMAMSADGPLGDDPLYYGGAVDLNLAGLDSLSGMANLAYSLDSGAWQNVAVTGSPSLAEHVIRLDEQGRHTIDYRGTDAAGNQSDSGNLVVRIDSVAPASPIALEATPSTWNTSSSFDVCWENPFDYSGLNKVYVKYGTAPVNSEDYDSVTSLVGSQNCLTGLTAYQEGENLAYVWLSDRAGNVDHTSAAQVAMYYDASKPSTAATPSGTMGENNYYVSTVAICLEAQDAVSGVSATNYRINGGTTLSWTGQDIVLDNEGQYEIEYWSEDIAGNQEQPHQIVQIKIDLYAPIASISIDTDYAPDGTAYVTWIGSDSTLGSGVQDYNVRYKQGGCSPWQSWISGTPSTGQPLFSMMANNFYYVGVQAQDNAGHYSIWTPDAYAPIVYVEGLGNPDFELQQLGAWQDDGPLGSAVAYAPSYNGTNSYMGRLATDYFHLVDCDEIQGISAPINGYGSLSQLIQLPSLTCDQGLMLSFRYRIGSFDTAIGIDSDDGLVKQFDPFLLHIRDINGVELASVMPAGNLTDWTQWIKCVAYDSGWRTQVVDLSPWAGERIWIDFRVWNYVDEGWPTWAYVDDVQLLPRDGRVVHLPIVAATSGNGTLSANSEVHSVDISSWPLASGRKPRWVVLGE